jgi:hypothetical protein
VVCLIRVQPNNQRCCLQPGCMLAIPKLLVELSFNVIWQGPLKRVLAVCRPAHKQQHLVCTWALPLAADNIRR